MKDLIEFLEYISKLKLTVRTGWKMLEVKKGETIGSHSFGVTFLAWLLAKKKKIDVDKTIKMALIHDIIEGITGDIAFVEEKYKIKEDLEKKALPKLMKIIPNELRNDIRDLIQELIEEKTEEAKTVKEADRLDTTIQAHIYDKINDGKLSHFIEYAEETCRKKYSKEILDYIKSLQKKSK